jgi:two-component system, OmpR family, sensor histidine kinase MprB
MSLRRRLSYVAAAAVAIAILLAALVCYWVVRGQLRGQVDDALRAQATAVQHVGDQALNQQLPGIPPSAGGPTPYWQVLVGATNQRGGNYNLPIDSHVRAVANGSGGMYIRDVYAGNNHLRELVLPAQVRVGFDLEPAAVQLARPLSGTDHVLAHLRLILTLLAAGGIALAALLGRLAARSVLAPLAEVAQTAQHISETEDLTSRIHVHHDDEVGQLATRFNAMIERLQHSRAELDESVRAQRQLVADASHELRTPITSLRTNIEVLLAGGRLTDEDRRRLLTDVVEQSEEMSALISDLIDLARGDLPPGMTEDVRLDRIVEDSVARARRDNPEVVYDVSLAPVVVEGVPERLARAANNLLDNAARHSPPRGVIEVTVDAAGLRVRDHGTGVVEADLPFVFDRFFRGTNSRGRQGSGLGLAIVRQVAIQHGGSVSAANSPEGGAIFSISLPTVTGEDPDPLETLRPSEAGRRAPV